MDLNTKIIKPKDKSLEMSTYFTICPICKVKNKDFIGGKLKIKNIPSETREELFNLISGFDKRLELRNSKDRIINIRTERGVFLIFTNNNELITKIEQKIKDTYYKIESKIIRDSELRKTFYTEIDFKYSKYN